MVTLDEIAKIIWRDTYRHDTLLEWHEIKRNTTHWRRVMAAAETVRGLISLRKSRLADTDKAQN